MSPATATKTPLLFISHKHSDWEIAKTLAQFLKKTTANQIRIHLSSGSDDEAPAPGRNLNQQLRDKLWESEALILIYTDSEKDWGYCLWECGVATLPGTPETNAVVLQCGNDAPTVYEDLVRIKASDLTALKLLIKAMCRDPKFFRARTEPLTRLSERDCDEAASDLHRQLDTVIRSHQRTESWSPWPSLTISLADENLSSLKDVADRGAVIREAARVTRWQNSAANLFGLGLIKSGTLLRDLMRAKSDKNGGTDWLDSCCDQVGDCAIYAAPVVKAVTLRAPGADTEYTPVVTSVRRIFSDKMTEFEISFYNLSDPRGIPVLSRMVPVQQLLYKNLDEA
jgi:hypothetical protein